jgi:CO/xanthine dehydrogenase FAD-binding subunit
MQAFDYIAASSLDQAVGLLSQHGEQASPLNGGTDLIVQLRSGQRRVKLLVDIKNIPEANWLTYDASLGLTIGAAISCAKLCSDPTISALYPGLCEAAALIGGTQIQARATLGGNLCNASPAADSLPALIVHRATCLITGPAGDRWVKIEDFCTAPGQTILQRGELLVALRLPSPQKRGGAAYLRFTPRSEMDIAVVGAGAALILQEDSLTIDSARIALGAVAPTPLLVPEAGDFLKGKPATPDIFEQAAQLAQAAARPISDLRGTATFRRHLCAVLTRRALEKAYTRAIEDFKSNLP